MLVAFLIGFTLVQNYQELKDTLETPKYKL